MLQEDHQEAQVRPVPDSVRYAFVDPDATDEIDRAPAKGDEPSDDVDDQC